MLDKAKVTKFQDELQVVLKALADKHGLTSAPTKIVYDRDGRYMKVAAEFGDKSMIGDVDPALLKDTLKYGYLFDLKDEDCGKATFSNMGEIYVFQGLRGRVTAVCKKQSDGKMYRFDAKRVCSVLGRAQYGV